MSSPKIVVIGAGPSGLAATVGLYKNGFTNLTVLEAENRIGGRINTIKWGESTVDLGAMWCHGQKDSVVYEMVKDLDLLKSSRANYKDNSYYTSKGKMVDKNMTDYLYDTALSVSHNEEDKDVREVLGNHFMKGFMAKIEEKFGSDKESIEISLQFMHWYHNYLNKYKATPNWYMISPHGAAEYINLEGDLTLGWQDKGYKIFLDVLTGKYPTKTMDIDQYIHLNKDVQTIQWSHPEGEEITIKCLDGTKYHCDHLIVTTSLGVLKEQHNRMFVPQLPFQKKQAIKSLGFGTVDKLIMKFPKTWWDKDDTSFCFLWSEQDKIKALSEFPYGPTKNGQPWVSFIYGFFVIEGDSSTLLGWFANEMNPEVESCPEEIIKKGCMYVLRKFLGHKYDISDPTEFICTSWNTNRHFRGSYSYRGLEFDQIGRHLDQDLAEPLCDDRGCPKVLFAGEATHPSYFSTVHGATETGFREAKRIADYYKK